MTSDQVREIDAMKEEALSLAWPIERAFVSRRYDKRFRSRTQIDYWLPKYQAKGNRFMASQCVQGFWGTKGQRSIVIGLAFYFLNWWQRHTIFVLAMWIFFLIGLVLFVITDVRRRTLNKQKILGTDGSSP
jgi:hypothetical protein